MEISTLSVVKTILYNFCYSFVDFYVYSYVEMYYTIKSSYDILVSNQQTKLKFSHALSYIITKEIYRFICNSQYNIIFENNHCID